MNKYYLLDNVKQTDNVVLDFATYRGGKSQLEKQLAEKPVVFDSGSISLVDQDVEKRKGGKYLHLLVQGENNDYSDFENFLESSDIKLLGAKDTESESVDSLTRTYLPERTSEKLYDKVKIAGASLKKPLVGLDSALQDNDIRFGSAVVGVLSLIFGTFAYAMMSQENVHTGQPMASPETLSTVVTGLKCTAIPLLATAYGAIRSAAK